MVTASPIRQTPSSKSSVPSPAIAELTGAFPLSWSHYVRLLGVRNEHARAFYGTEALRGGWTVRQLDRQIGSQFYERTALSPITGRPYPSLGFSPSLRCSHLSLPIPAKAACLRLELAACWGASSLFAAAALLPSN